MASADANFYRLLIVALLEHGGPLTLEDVAMRFERAGVAPAREALASLKRCKPGRAPVYRDGEYFALDPHDDEVSFWLLRLGLRGPRFTVVQVARPAPGPLPSPDHPLTIAALDDAWRQGVPSTWSAQRVIVHAYPAACPEAVTMIDVAERTIETFVGAEMACVGDRLADYEVIGAVGVRPLLRALRVDPGERRLAELGPRQKTLQLNRRGRTLAITTALLVQSPCGIVRPFGDAQTLRTYLDSGAHTKLRRRLEADVKSLYALYQYGRLHGAVRLRWGFLDEMLPAPWVHRDEPMLHTLMRDAHARGVALEVVVGSAPGWEDPWSRVQLAHVTVDSWGTPRVLVDDQGWEIPRPELQLARLAGN